MSRNYSCFDAPVDLSLTGSQVSPSRKPKSSSARSSLSSRASVTSRHNRNDPPWRSATPKSNIPSARSTKRPHSVKDKSSSSLAMTFPAKGSKSVVQSNLTSTTSTTDDYLDSFFNQSSTKSKAKSSSSSNVKARSKSKVCDERVFSIPDTARSESVYSEDILSTKSSLLAGSQQHEDDVIVNAGDLNGSGDTNVDFLKSYISNIDRYKESIPSDEDAYQNLTSNAFFQEPPKPPPSSKSSTPIPKEELPPTSSNPLLDENVEHFRKNRSARKIQTWYRRHHARRKRNEAVMKRMLAEKKEDLQTSLMRESLRITQRSEEEKKIQRQQREREARKQAIKELEEKRRAEKEEIRRVAEEEIEIVKKKVEKEKKKLRSRVKKSETKPKTFHEDVPDTVPIPPAAEDAEIGSSKDRLSEADWHSEVNGSKPAEDVLKSRTTLDDVLETIKLLEEEPEHLPKPKSALDEKLSWIEDLQAELQSNVSKSSRASRATNTQQDPSSILTEAKLQSINNFLDEVEKKESPPLSQLNHGVAEKQLQEAEHAATEVTSQMLKLKLNLEEKSRSVKLLQDALTQQRELNQRLIKEQELEYNQRLKMQKDQYESAIQRHLSFIDQLIDDKKSLNVKCEKLLTDMKQAENRYQKKIKTLNETHQTEIKKSKDVLAAAEKIRREKWIDEKTKKIKEMTVKGLEPEIQRLIAKHKEEMKKVKSIQEAELLRSDERAGQRYIRQTEELREQLEREKEAACAREREMARLRYEKQMEQEEVALQQQRKRLFNEVAEEKERINQQATRQRKELEELKQQLEANSRIAASSLREEFEKSAEELQKRHKEDMKAMQERLAVEKQAWQENYMKKQEAFMMQKERELKEAVRRDRDSEIEAAILRLEDDMHQQREELDKTTDNRIKRIRDKYEAEMREVERSEKQTQEKYNSMKTEFNEIESENLRLQSLCKQKDQEVTDMLKIKNKLVEERGNVSEIIRQEFADRLVLTDEENKRMKNELSELRARQRLELERINNAKEEELTEVHKRVRQAIVKKEETISQIREQYDAALKRAEHLESLLEQQRKKLLGKKKGQK